MSPRPCIYNPEKFATEIIFALWFHPETLELAGFRLVDGLYRPILGNDRDWRYSEQLGLFLGVHEGKLRYFDSAGNLILTAEETALQAQAQAEQQHQRAEALAEKLRSLGIDPD